MKNLKNLFVPISLGLAFLFTSCDKSDEKEKESLLSKITTNYDDGVSQISEYSYDSQNRLTKTINTTIDSIGTTKYVLSYTYSGNGKLDEELVTLNETMTSKTKYFWTSDSITVTTINNDENETDLKIVLDLDSAGYFTKSTFLFDPNNSGNWIKNTYTLYLWTGGNLEKTERYFAQNVESGKSNSNKSAFYAAPIVSNIKTADDYLINTTTYEYDDRLNPFSGFGIMFQETGLNKNNLIKIISIYDNPWGDDFTNTTECSYEYNDKNYPTKRTNSWVDSEGVTHTDITLYEYTAK